MKTETYDETKFKLVPIESPIAEIWWDDTKDCEWQLKMLVEPSVYSGVRIPLYSGDYDSAPVMYINDDGSFFTSD